jgi:hypothetical protein
MLGGVTAKDPGGMKLYQRLWLEGTGVLNPEVEA